MDVRARFTQHLSRCVRGARSKRFTRELESLERGSRMLEVDLKRLEARLVQLTVDPSTSAPSDQGVAA